MNNMQYNQTRPHSRQASISAPSPLIDPVTYLHSPAHLAVARKDHAGLRKIISGLPQLAPATDVHTENDAIAEEAKAEALSAVLDNRDVPGRETPLHLAVRLGDAIAAEILMSAGADCSLQNENGWSSLQEAICARQDAIAKIIVKHYQRLGWAKWCRRLPRIVATMNRMRDFYMEVSFNFESSVIPLIARAAPSDTYRIWKRGPNFRADMTLSGFDGFKIQRSGQTFFFLGEGSKDGRLPPGSLCVLDHKSKVIANALDGADKNLTDNEVAQEVSLMARTNLYRPGIDVTQAVLVPQLSWMWQEKVEIVHGWKAKLYDMHNVMLSVKTRQVPGAMTDEEFFQSLPNLDGCETSMGEDYMGLLKRPEERKRHGENASTSRNALEDVDSKHRPKIYQTKAKDIASPTASSTVPASNIAADDRKGWFGRNRRTVHQDPNVKLAPARSSLSSGKQGSDLLKDDEEEHAANKAPRLQRGRRSIDAPRPNDLEMEEMATTYVMERRNKNKSRFKPSSEGIKESEYKKGLRPVLWLTPDFPLRTEELLPLLDILASKVKAVRRLRELLTTKFPQGTFPVKIAFPVIPTIRVVITFSRFQEVQSNDDFPTPSISPSSYHDEYQSSWLSWVKGPMAKPVGPTVTGHATEDCDPFTIPKDYKWNKPAAKKGKTASTKS